MYRMAMIFLKIGPRSFHYRLGRRLVAIWLWICPRDLNIVQNNIKHIVTKVPQLKKNCKLAQETFYHFARYWVDFFSSRNLSLTELNSWMKFEGMEHFDVSLTKGNGVIALTGHVGNWELGGLALGLKDYSIAAVALEHANASVNQMFVGQRESKGVQVIPLGNAGRECIRVLRNNRVLALLGDRIFDEKEKGISVNFFDSQMLVPRGAAILSLKTGAAIVPCFIIMQKNGGYIFRAYAPLGAGLDISLSQDEKIALLMQEYASIMEGVVSQHPEQWFAFQNIWKED